MFGLLWKTGLQSHEEKMFLHVCFTTGPRFIKYVQIIDSSSSVIEKIFEQKMS